MKLNHLQNQMPVVRREHLFVLRNSSALTEVDNATPSMARGITDTWPAAYVMYAAADEASLAAVEDRFQHDSGLLLRATLHVDARHLQAETREYKRKAVRDDSVFALGSNGFNQLELVNKFQTAAALAACGTPVAIVSLFGRSQKQLDLLQQTLLPSTSPA